MEELELPPLEDDETPVTTLRFCVRLWPPEFFRLETDVTPGASRIFETYCLLTGFFQLFQVSRSFLLLLLQQSWRWNIAIGP